MVKSGFLVSWAYWTQIGFGLDAEYARLAWGPKRSTRNQRVGKSDGKIHYFMHFGKNAVLPHDTGQLPK